MVPMEVVVEGGGDAAIQELVMPAKYDFCSC